jgi:uncharacterized protein YbjQ (UPF0145 family)
VIIIVNTDQVSELKMTSHAGGFTGNALHSTSITKDAVGIIIQKLETLLVVDGS